MHDNVNRRAFLKATTAGIVGTAVASGTAAAATYDLHDPVFTSEGTCYVHNTANVGDVKKTVGEDVGLWLEDGPEYNDGYTWWWCRVNGDDAWEDDVEGWVVEKEMELANFGYPTYGRLSSDHDDCRDSCTRTHDAVDLANDVGTLVVTARPGTVDFIDDDGDSGYGKWVQVDHGSGWKTRYAHLSKFYCSGGDELGWWDHVGALGDSGDSSGPHCHFEIRLNGTKLDWPTREDAYIARATGVPRDFA